jgi:hypothetical protein
LRARAIHGFENRGSTDATFLAIASPGVFGPAYIQDVGEVVAASACSSSMAVVFPLPFPLRR